MEVQFSAEQEAHLLEIAHHQGRNAEQVVKDATLRLLAEDEELRAAVRAGIVAADQGEFVEHERVWSKVEEILSGR